MTQYQAAPPPAASDPNRTLTIVGFVLAFLCSIVGLVISIIAYNRSKQLGYENGLAKAGIIVAIVFMVLSVLGNIAARSSGLYGR
jgi:preprotein translocase subunit SecG